MCFGHAATSFDALDAGHVRDGARLGNTGRKHMTGFATTTGQNNECCQAQPVALRAFRTSRVCGKSPGCKVMFGTGFLEEEEAEKSRSDINACLSVADWFSNINVHSCCSVVDDRQREHHSSGGLSTRQEHSANSAFFSRDGGGHCSSGTPRSRSVQIAFGIPVVFSSTCTDTMAWTGMNENIWKRMAFHKLWLETSSHCCS